MRTCHTGFHYTPVDSIAPWVQPWAVSQSLSATKLPGNRMIQYHLGMASAQLGDKDAARQVLSAPAASPIPFPGQDEARKALAALT